MNWSLAILLGGSTLLAAGQAHAGASLQSATEAEKARASEEYAAGVSAYREGDFEQALAAFSDSYRTVESPNSHLMMAKALIDLKRYLEAHQVLLATVQESEAAQAQDPKYADTAAAARADLQNVEGRLGRLEVTWPEVSGDAMVRVGEREFLVATLSNPLWVLPGVLDVSLLENGERRAQATVVAVAGQSTAVELGGETAVIAEGDWQSTDRGPYPDRRELVYVASGIGVVGLLGFGVFGILSERQYGDLEDECRSGACPSSSRSEAIRGHRYQTFANIGLTVGLVGLGTGLGLYLMGEDSESAPREPTTVSVGIGSLQVQGVF